MTRSSLPITLTWLWIDESETIKLEDSFDGHVDGRARADSMPRVKV